MFGEPTIVKKNYAIQMINRLTMKVNPKSKAAVDPAPRTRPFMDPDHELGYSESDETLPKFEQRYLNNVVNTDQFTHMVSYGRNVEWLEKQGYKLFHFIQQRGQFKLHRLVSDWVKGNDGQVWLLGVKSFTVSPIRIKKPIVIKLAQKAEQEELQ